jgi:hypothetical protein
MTGGTADINADRKKLNFFYFHYRFLRHRPIAQPFTPGCTEIFE